MKPCTFLLLLTSLFGFSNFSQAQEEHFSNKESYLFQRNTAVASFFEGEWQASSAHRRQWASVTFPFITSTLYLNKKFHLPKRSIKLHAGLLYIQDQSGDAELTIDNFLAHFGGTYRYLQHQFSANTQFGIVSKQLSDGNLTMPGQFDRETGGFNINLPGGEALESTSLSFFDLNLSLGWKYRYNEKWEVGSGVTVRHLLQSEASFLEENNQIPMGVGVQLFATYFMNDQNRLKPIFYDYRRKKSSETLIGLEWEHTLSKNQSPFDAYYLGTYTRQAIGSNTDALILGGGVELNAFRLGVAYDINLSDLELASGNRGGVEFQLIYTGKIKSLKKIAIPCEHY